MPTLQEQDEDLAGAYSLCGQAALPRAGIDEHRGQDVHEAIWYLGSIGFHVGACGRCMSWKSWIVVTVNQLRVVSSGRRCLSRWDFPFPSVDTPWSGIWKDMIPLALRWRRVG